MKATYLPLQLGFWCRAGQCWGTAILNDNFRLTDLGFSTRSSVPLFFLHFKRCQNWRPKAPIKFQV